MAPDPASTTGDAIVSRDDIIFAMCRRLERLSSGNRAALRRLALGRPEVAVGVVTGLLVGAGAPEVEISGRVRFERWTLLAHVAALLSGTGSGNPHGTDARLGRVLHDADYSELRLMRLTSASGPALVDQIKRAARFLAAKGQTRVDLRTVHDLSRDLGAAAEGARLRIARDYFAAQHAAKKDAS